MRCGVQLPAPTKPLHGHVCRKDDFLCQCCVVVDIVVIVIASVAIAVIVVAVVAASDANAGLNEV